MEEKSKKNWTISLGLYPGILLGARTYDHVTSRIFVLYLPFIDLAFEVSYE